MRKCGLKLYLRGALGLYTGVTSLAEVWIEILKDSVPISFSIVTSLAEVWIEMISYPYVSGQPLVTSLAEVWIEIRGIQAS